MRLFIAINITPEVKLNLKNVQDSWKAKGIRGNFTPEENLHLTLAFIGEYPDPDEILDVMESVQLKPFTITIKGFGNFDDLLWVGIEPSLALTKTVSQIRRTLAQHRIPYDNKRFTPHITMVRKVVFPKDFPVLDIQPITMVVDHLSLMRSDRGKHQMIYTEMGSIEL